MLKDYHDIDSYISRFPAPVQVILNSMRSIIQKAAPEATERISYGIPTFTSGRNLVHFAGYKKHIGFYPGAAGIAFFTDKLFMCKTSKGAVQFPIDKPLPAKLITTIVKYRVNQNKEKTFTKN